MMEPHAPAFAVGLFDVEEETLEAVGPYSFIQKRRSASVQRFTQDSVLLADFILPLKEDDPVIDLGTGSGIIPVLLSWKSPAKNITGVEVVEEAGETAMRNVRLNGLCPRVAILNMDFRELPSIYPEGSFSVVVSNPPYVKSGAGRVSPVKERAIARSEQMGALKDLLEVSRHLAGRRGRICYVFPATRLDEMLSGMEKAGLERRRLEFVRSGPDKEPRVFLIEAVRSGLGSGG